MITNNALAAALNDDRTRRNAERYRLHAETDAKLHATRRAIGRWLETFGRRLQRSARVSSPAPDLLG
jgi:hypothetical protein